MGRSYKVGMVGALVLGMALVCASAPAVSQARSVRLVNESGKKMMRFYATRIGESNWGEDHLGEAVLPDGGSFTVNFPSSDFCKYDLKAIFEGDQEVVNNRVDICENQVLRYTENGRLVLNNVPVPNNVSRSLSIVNESGVKIMRFYASPGSSSEWGEDRLGSNVLPDGQSYAASFPAGECDWDFKAVFEGGAEVVKNHVNICEISVYRFSGIDDGKPVTVRNNTGIKIMRFYASPSSTDQWGEDRLGSNTVPAGQTYVFKFTTGECDWDFKAVLEGGAEIVKKHINVCQISEYSFGDVRSRTITVVNRTGSQIQRLYCSSSASTEWGDDRLGSEVLPSGQSYSLSLPGSDCEFDLKAVLVGDSEVVRNHVNLCNVTEYVFGRTEPDGRTISIVNNTGSKIMRLYGSPSSSGEWGEDRLGQDVLPNGHSFSVTFQSSECEFDLKAVLEGDAEIVRNHVNICNTSEYRFTN